VVAANTPEKIRRSHASGRQDRADRSRRRIYYVYPTPRSVAACGRSTGQYDRYEKLVEERRPEGSRRPASTPVENFKATTPVNRAALVLAALGLTALGCTLGGGVPAKR